MAPDGELADSPALAPLVHRFCHAHQRLEWGMFRYLWRHLKSRLYRRGVPLWHRETERECYQAANLVLDYYATRERIQQEPPNEGEAPDYALPRQETQGHALLNEEP